MKLSAQLSRHERPRERLLRHGASSLRDAELLAIALRTGVPGRNVLELGNLLLERFQGLRGLLGATPEELQTVPGLGQAKACSLAGNSPARAWPPEADWLTRLCSTIGSEALSSALAAVAKPRNRTAPAIHGFISNLLDALHGSGKARA